MTESAVNFYCPHCKATTRGVYASGRLQTVLVCQTCKGETTYPGWVQAGKRGE